MNDNAIIPPGPGALLVAHPRMDDPNFSRTVVLLIAHEDEVGSMGVVLNRPDGSDLPDNESPLQRWVHSSAPPYTTFIGGPVEESGFICLRRDSSTTSGVHSVDMVGDHPHSEQPHRVFRGYAGWSAHQLHEEIVANGWFVVLSHHNDAFDTDPDTLWQRVLQRQNATLRRLANYPDVPELN